MVIIKGKIRVSGNSYMIPVKKALIDSEVIKPGIEYVFELKEVIKRLLSVLHSKPYKKGSVFYGSY